MKCYPGLEEIKKPLLRNPSWWTNRDFTEWKLVGDFSWLKWSMSNLFGGLSTWQIRWTRLSWMIAKFSTRNHDNLRVALYEVVINHHCPLLISTRKNPQPIIGSFMSWSSWRVKVDIKDMSNSTLVDKKTGLTLALLKETWVVNNPFKKKKLVVGRGSFEGGSWDSLERILKSHARWWFQRFNLCLPSGKQT